MSYTNSEGQDYRFHPIPAAAWSVENTAFNRSAVRIAEKLYVICPLRRDSFIAALQGHSSNSQRATTRQGRPSKNWGLIFRIAIEVMEDQSLAGHQMAQASMIAEIYERETGESVSKTTIRKKLKEWEPFAVFRPF
jgi:hypothetical protein